MGDTIALSDNGQRTDDSSLSHVLKGGMALDGRAGCCFLGAAGGSL
jgi:hypothetical protein